MKQILKHTILAAAAIGLAILMAPDVATAQNRARAGNAGAGNAGARWDVAVTLQQTLTAEQKEVLINRRAKATRGQRGERGERGHRAQRGQRGQREARKDVMATRQSEHLAAMQSALDLSDEQVAGLQDVMKLQPQFRRDAIKKLGLGDAQLETMQLHRALGRKQGRRNQR